jgi:hypothetical protein
MTQRERPGSPAYPVRTTPIGAAVNVLLRPAPRVPRWLHVISIAAIVAGAGLVATSAVIHLHLWLQGYRDIHVIGPLFLVQAVAGIMLALVMIGVRRFIIVLAGAGYLASTAGGLLLSTRVAIFGFNGTLDVAWASTSLYVEIIGAALLACTAAVIAVRR